MHGIVHTSSKLQVTAVYQVELFECYYPLFSSTLLSR